MANRRASEPQEANSKSAGINFRRVRSPEAPKITIAQGSATATELCASSATVSAISLVIDAIKSSSYKRGRDATLGQRCAQACGRTKENRPHPQSFGRLKVPGTIIDQDAFPGSALRDSQREAVDQRIGFARSQIARSKGGIKVSG